MFRNSLYCEEATEMKMMKNKTQTSAGGFLESEP